MSELSIKVEGLSKEYIVGGAEEQYESFRDMLTSALNSPLRKFKKLSGSVEEDSRFWALKDIDFEINQGDVVGVVGHNGAGKSTLLKVLSRITTPTKGRIEIHGRVASLLEVGTGFHPELTGRENIYLNGSILGMKRYQIDKKFDEIVEFAEVTDFLDTPVKRYSSGMYVRLAFSVAAHLDTDVLMVDEILSVGDTKFRDRCVGRMNEVSRQGRTVIFVSHNLGLVQELCDHSIYLKKGMLVQKGLTSDVLPNYLQEGEQNQSAWKSDNQDDMLREVHLIANDGGAVSSIGYEQQAYVKISFLPDRKDRDFVLAIRITDELGRDVMTSWDSDSYTRKTQIGNDSEVMCHLPMKLLRPGSYYLTVMARKSLHGYIEKVEEAQLNFEVTNLGFRMNENRFGIVLPTLTWSNKSL